MLTRKPPNPKTLTLNTIIISTILSCQITHQFPTIEHQNTKTAQSNVTIALPETQGNNTRPTVTPSVQLHETDSLGKELTQTPSPIPPTANTDQAISVYPQAQSPVYLVNFLHPELGCQWAGIAGQIFNIKGEPVNGYIIEVSGNLDGKEFLGLGLTGTSLPIGPGGYDIKIADHPFDSHHSLFLRVYDQNGNQLNETIALTTYNDCGKNLILINFILLSQPLKEKIFFPIVSR